VRASADGAWTRKQSRLEAQGQGERSETSRPKLLEKPERLLEVSSLAASKSETETVARPARRPPVGRAARRGEARRGEARQQRSAWCVCLFVSCNAAALCFAYTVRDLLVEQRRERMAGRRGRRVRAGPIGLRAMTIRHGKARQGQARPGKARQVCI
jgi:hypothetical protein